MKLVMGLLMIAVLTAGVAVAVLIEPHSFPSIESAVASSEFVYASEHTKKYHKQECHGLAHARAADIVRLNREDAEAAGYIACHECFSR